MLPQVHEAGPQRGRAHGGPPRSCASAALWALPERRQCSDLQAHPGARCGELLDHLARTGGLPRAPAGLIRVRLVVRRDGTVGADMPTAEGGGAWPLGLQQARSAVHEFLRTLGSFTARASGSVGSRPGPRGQAAAGRVGCIAARAHPAESGRRRAYEHRNSGTGDAAARHPWRTPHPRIGRIDRTRVAGSTAVRSPLSRCDGRYERRARRGRG